MTSPAKPAGYRALPRVAGWSYLATAILGRPPLAMVPLAILTLATSATGSLAIGGFAAAAAAVGEAAGAPLAGRLADRFGQLIVLLVGVALHLAAMLSFGVAAGVATDAATIALAAVAGATLPQLGPLSRARWLAMAGPEDLPAAFAFEGVADEVAFIIGPALVGLTATFVSPYAALLLSVALVGVFVTAFAVHPSHRLVPRAHSGAAGPGGPGGGTQPRVAPGRTALVACCFTGMLSMGLFFGGSQTGLTAFAARIGIPDTGALLYAIMAVGSAVTTLSMVRLPAHIPLTSRWIVAAVGLAAGSLLMLSAGGLGDIVFAALVAGAFQGPVLLTMFSVAGSLAESGRAGGLLTFVGSGNVLGVALGTAIAGPLAERCGPAGGFSVVTAAAALAVVTGLLAASSPFARRHGIPPAGAESDSWPRTGRGA
ncbi:MAG: MFS transporter [Microbacterium sp.]